MTGADRPRVATASAATPDTTRVLGSIESLNAAGDRRVRERALRIAVAGLRACDAARATAAAVSFEGGELVIEGREYPIPAGGRVLVLGAGKASLPIAAELERILGARIDGGAIVVRSDEPGQLERIDVIEADHPLPNGRSNDAATRLLALVSGLGENDLVLACFTGGSSALASLPPEGVTGAEKRELHELLLSAGIGIVEVNTVRKHVSAFKGGRLAAAAAPARLVNLTVSDVAGNHLDAITDPSVPDSSSAADAIGVLRGHSLWARVPASIREHLQSARAESPRLDPGAIHSVVLVSGPTACDAMAIEAASLGLRPVVISTTLEGEARQVGKLLGNLARHSAADATPFAPGTVMLGCGGESTVTLARDGSFGEGGPNQEAAIAAALEIEGASVAAVFLDTDGADGGTGHAGAVVDGLTVERAASADVDLRLALLEHRSEEALSTLGDALVTGPTGTNVNDLFAIVVEGAR